MEKLLTSHQAAKLLSIWPQTLNRWEREGKLKPLRTSGGHRRYIYGKRGGRVTKKLTELIKLEVTADENNG